VSRPRLLDLFCGAGGCAMGYYRAGFDVVGVDIKPQPRFPFPFEQGDAILKLRHLLDSGFIYPNGKPLRLENFAAIHASPPCQIHSQSKNIWKGRRGDGSHQDLVPDTRRLLEKSALPWVIENVVGSPLTTNLTLCGSMFGLKVKRHRLFETSVLILSGLTCRKGHPEFEVSVFGGGAKGRRQGHKFPQNHVKHEVAKIAMGIDWMTRDELSQAIPPAYTEYIGKQLLRHIQDH